MFSRGLSLFTAFLHLIMFFSTFNFKPESCQVKIFCYTNQLFCLQTAEEEQQQDITVQMVWTPEKLARNVFLRINMYKDTMLRPLEVSLQF